MKTPKGKSGPTRRARKRRLVIERLSQRRVLASIAGSVFEDLNLSSQREVGEPVAPRRLVYIDANDNANLDNGERFVIAEDDGSFQFDGLVDGTYQLRLFNGTSTQTQTTPLTATVSGFTITVDGANEVLPGDNGLSIALTDQSVIVGRSSNGSSQPVPLGNQLTKMQTLPDGRLLVIGSNSNGPTSWIVDPVSATATTVNLSGGASTPWSALAIDGDGRGVLLDQSIGQSIVRSVDATNPAGGISTVVTDAAVPTDTQVLTSLTGPRTVFAWNGDDGLEARLWSNVNGEFITEATFELDGTTSLLSFDDASGLLAARNVNGGVNVYDVDANFAALHSLDNVDGPVAIDGIRELLVTVSPLDSMLRLINLRDGALVADLALELSSIGSVASLALDNKSDAVVVLGAAGLAEVALQRTAAQEVTIEGGQDVDSVLFGVALLAPNAPPQYDSLPAIQTNEDTPLTLGQPGALAGSLDAQNDHYVLVQLTQASNGIVQAALDGSLHYTPRPDFNGTDSFTALLHDGRDASEAVQIEISVLPVPDPPDDIIVNLPPIPEHLPIGTNVGTIEVIDADGGGHTILINDPRFEVVGDDIIFVGGDVNFEDEPFVNITVTVIDPELGTVTEEIVAATVQDENDPITDITPHEVEVREMDGFIGPFHVHDEDTFQTHTLEVDDERMEFIGHELWMKQGEELDFEQEQTVIVNVTATEVPGGGTFTRAVTIHVRDVPEQPTSIQLSGETVLELHAGDVVGEVTVDGVPPNPRFDLLVDDPRFEIDGNTLKLRDDQIVERALQSEIELLISAVDTQGNFNPISRVFVIEVMENSAPFHNHDNPYDVDHSGRVTALDALVIVNYLNSFGPGPVGRGNPTFCYDVNADSLVTALDALLVLNELARIEDGAGTVGGEGEAAPAQNPVDQAAGGAEGEYVPPIQAAPVQQRDNKIGSFAGSEASPSNDPAEFADETSAQQYAESVDRSIGLLSDES